MSVKTITIRSEVYKLLSEMKRENESFSDLLLRLTKKKSSPMDFFGALEGSPSLEVLEAGILEARKQSGLRDVFS